MDKLEALQDINRAHVIVGKDTQLGMAAAQLAMALAASGEKPRPIFDRLQSSEIEEDIEPTSVLSDEEKRFLPTAEVIVGLIYSAGQQASLRAARAALKSTRR